LITKFITRHFAKVFYELDDGLLFKLEAALENLVYLSHIDRLNHQITVS
jgi:hypothetical protein